ncbi:MAG: glycosyltransferase, partial [Sphingobacteriales bacterium]
CIESVLAQDYLDIEYLIIDGGSTDGTISVINRYIESIDYFGSNRDLGMYDALNKGISLAKGDLIGILNADDYLADEHVVSSIVKCFSAERCDAVYGNLKFVKRDKINSTTRNWKSKPHNFKDLLYGWMPAHPTLYVKKDVLFAAGLYSLKFGTCADYDMILRLLHQRKIDAVFLNKNIVVMRSGGMSNGSFRKVSEAVVNDYRVLVHNRIPRPLITLLLKKIRKLEQFF